MKLSIITINLNCAEGLRRTIESVISQTFEDFEYIVIDGASTDESVDVIKQYADKIAYWISEPDAGIYNAMNKGIKKANGEYCLFLNSGDWLINSDSLKNAFNIIMNSEEAEIYYGDCVNSEFGSWKMPKRLSIIDLYLQIAPSHQNTIIKSSLFFDHEFYDENFPTVSDSIFFVKEFWLYQSRFIYIDTIISVYSVGGISSIYKYAQQELHEQMKKIMGSLHFYLMILSIKKTKKIEKLQGYHLKDFFRGVKKKIKQLLLKLHSKIIKRHKKEDNSLK